MFTHAQGPPPDAPPKRERDLAGETAAGTHAEDPGARGISELRFEELRGEEVVYAIDRQERTFLPPAEHCPLCPTKPGDEPTEIPFPEL